MQDSNALSLVPYFLAAYKIEATSKEIIRVFVHLYSVKQCRLLQQIHDEDIALAPNIGSSSGTSAWYLCLPMFSQKHEYPKQKRHLRAFCSPFSLNTCNDNTELGICSHLWNIILNRNKENLGTQFSKPPK